MITVTYHEKTQTLPRNLGLEFLPCRRLARQASGHPAFFDSQPHRRFELYISEVVLEEIKRAATPKREQLLQLIDLHQPKILALDTTVHQLADAYLAHQILPAKSGYDAQHIATATVYELDVIVSWNLRHIANLNRQRRVQSFNFTNGYNKPLVMLTPIEVTDDE